MDEALNGAFLYAVIQDDGGFTLILHILTAVGGGENAPARIGYGQKDVVRGKTTEQLGIERGIVFIDLGIVGIDGIVDFLIDVNERLLGRGLAKVGVNFTLRGLKRARIKAKFSQKNNGNNAEQRGNQPSGSFSGSRRRHRQL
jgi:hypothetical protein